MYVQAHYEQTIRRYWATCKAPPAYAGRYSLVKTLGTEARSIFSPAFPARMSSCE